MSLYALIRKIGIGEPSALGLDTSVVVVERVPLIIANRAKHIRRIERIKPEKCDNDSNIVLEEQNVS